VRNLWASAPAEARAEIGYEVAKIGDCVISAAAADTSILANRTLCLDALDQDAQIEVAQRAIDTYTRLGVEKYFIYINPDASESLTDFLTPNGLKKGRAWMKFSRDVSPTPAPDTNLTVKEIDASDAETFGQIVAPCFDMSPAFGRILAAAAQRESWHVFMAFDEGKPARAGCLITHDDVGLLDMGATHADFRRKGAGCRNGSAHQQSRRTGAGYALHRDRRSS